MSHEKQLPLFDATTAWFHVFKSMIDSGDIAAIGPYATTVYLVIKGYTNWKSGKSWPGVDLIVEKTGISRRKVLECLKILEERGYLKAEKRGRKNVYTLREKVSICDPEEDSRPVAMATWDYLPSTVAQAGAELRDFLLTGSKEGMQVVHIENLSLTINVQNIHGNHNTGNQVNASATDWDAIPDEHPVKRAMLAQKKGQPASEG